MGSVEPCRASRPRSSPRARRRLRPRAAVARSGVAKSTVYRHWADRDALVADVFNVCAPQMVEPDADLAFEPALRQLVAASLEFMTDERWRRLAPALLVLKSEKTAIAALEDQMTATRPT